MMSGRNAQNEVVDSEKHENVKNKIRLSIMNPSWILAPQLQPGDVSGNGLYAFQIYNLGRESCDASQSGM